MLIAVALSVLHEPRWTFGQAYRFSFATLWGLENLLVEPDQTSAYYVVAGGASIAGVVLPLLLLGSFVYKLLRHDPIQWRLRMSVEDDSKYGAVLSIRFYPGTSSALGDLRVRAYARIAYTQGQPRTIVNRPLRVIYGGEIAAESHIPYSSSGFPCTVRVPLSKQRGAISTEMGSKIDIQGEDVERSNAEIMVIVSGAVLDSGESFVSVRRYNANDDLLAGQPQWVDAVEDGRPKDWLGWENFENNAELLVFVYGSMVNFESMQRTAPSLRPVDGPFPAYLNGWVRAWNVGTDPGEQPERIWRGENGSPFQGTIASLGLAEQTGAECFGAVYRISVRDLPMVDQREHDYTRTTVTGFVHGPGLNPEATVITYVPKTEATHRMRKALADNTAVLSRSYVKLVEDGFEALAPDGLQVYRHTTPRFPGHIETLTWERID